MEDLITIGFDRNGEANFKISATIGDLNFDKMQDLRAMIPVAIAQAENMWIRSRDNLTSQSGAQS